MEKREKKADERGSLEPGEQNGDEFHRFFVSCMLHLELKKPATQKIQRYREKKASAKSFSSSPKDKERGSLA